VKTLEAVLLTLRANAEAEAAGGEIMPIGRTAMQKLVYFASLKIGLDAWYYAHYYGPFSEGVSMEIARLWGHELIREDAPTRTKPGYTYTLTREGGAPKQDGRRGERGRLCQDCVHCEGMPQLLQAAAAAAGVRLKDPLPEGAHGHQGRRLDLHGAQDRVGDERGGHRLRPRAALPARDRQIANAGSSPPMTRFTAMSGRQRPSMT